MKKFIIGLMIWLMIPCGMVYAYRMSQPRRITDFDERNLVILNDTIGELWNITNGRMTEFDDDITLYGDAKVWKADDLVPGIIGHPSTTPPDSDDYLGWVFDLFDDGPNEEQVFHKWHIPTDFAEGDSSIRGHFGFMVINPPGAGSVTVKMGFEYKKMEDGDVMAFTAGSESGDVITETILDAEAAYTWHETDTGSVTTTGWESGDIVLFRFYRDATNDNYVGDAWVGIYHLEYLIDKLGENAQ